ncbi:hypothetical protein L7F22_064729 [Adiantum nelumboides]|nr:hypothetical protein [Adiantum nelumboides]
MCKELIKAAQALMEPNVEIKVSIHKELEKRGIKESKQVNGPRPDTILSLNHRMVPKTTDEARSMELMPIPKVEEPWPQSLWETIRNRKDESAMLQSAPIPKIILDNEFYPGDMQSLYGDARTEVSMESKPQSLKTLPSFLGEHQSKLEVMIVPSQMRTIPKMIDSKSLQEMLSTPVTCTITLSELLKIRPHLWEEMGKHLETKVIKNFLQTNPPMEETKFGDQPKAQPVPINKVRDYFEGMSKSKVKMITKDAENYILIEDNLYKRGKDDQLRMCTTEEENGPILEQAHSGQVGGHFFADKTTKAILVAGIWWPTLFMDAEEFVKRCDDCQSTKTPRGRDDMPLRPMMGARAFAKWGIDFVGPIAPLAYRTHPQYINVVIDYLTKWVEARATTKNDTKMTSQFLYENIFTRYGLPIEIVSDSRGTHFINEVIEFLLDEFMVMHQKSTPYHPQANGQAKSTNKILVTILTKIVTKDLEWTGHELLEQLKVLEKLDEIRLRAVALIYAQKKNMKSFFDQHVINKEFATGDYILMHTLKQHSRKLKKQRNGPYVIHDISSSGAIKLATLEEEDMLNWISGYRLKKYHLPLTSDMLAKIHSAKEQKNKIEETKAHAQEEAKTHILKCKQKLEQQRQPPIEETTPIPLTAIQSNEQWQIEIDIQINVRLPNGRYQRALIDTGARVNVVNYSTYKKLSDQPLM